MPSKIKKYNRLQNAVGRYATSDPIGLKGGLNTFGYVGGEPNKKIDMYGLEPGNAEQRGYGQNLQFCFQRNEFYPHAFLNIQNGNGFKDRSYSSIPNPNGGYDIIRNIIWSGPGKVIDNEKDEKLKDVCHPIAPICSNEKLIACVKEKIIADVDKKWGAFFDNCARNAIKVMEYCQLKACL